METQTETMERLADQPSVTGADFGYPEHAPDWLELGGARVCTVCGRVGLGGSPGTLLPTGVILGGGPRISDEAEDFYRQEKWS